jgi:hypothetical protein
MGPPKFPMLLFLRARHFDPDRPSGISPCLCLRSMFVFSVLCLVSRQCHMISTLVRTDDSSVLASSYFTLSPSALSPLTRLISLQGGASPLWPTRFSVYASPLLFTFATVSMTICNAVRQRRPGRDSHYWTIPPTDPDVTDSVIRFLGNQDRNTDPDA